jgi:hypothetical protein
MFQCFTLEHILLHLKLTLKIKNMSHNNIFQQKNGKRKKILNLNSLLK